MTKSTIIIYVEILKKRKFLNFIVKILQLRNNYYKKNEVKKKNHYLSNFQFFFNNI